MADILNHGAPLDALLPSPDTNELIAIYHLRTIAFNGPFWNFGYDIYLPTFGQRPVCAAGADVDGNGGADVVVGHASSRDLVVQLHATGGMAMTFDPGRLTYPLPAVPRQVVFADLNGDVRPELLALLVDGTLRVYRNTGLSGAARFDLASGAVLPVGADPAYLRVADVNGDGRTDIVVAGRGSEAVMLFYSVGAPLTTAAGTEAATVQPYPNPAHGTLRLAGASGAAVRLLDPLGRLVRHWPAAPATLDVADLPRGTYLLRVELASGPQTRRVVLE